MASAIPNNIPNSRLLLSGTLQPVLVSEWICLLYLSFSLLLMPQPSKNDLFLSPLCLCASVQPCRQCKRG